jgi:hypothetical protein
MAEGGVGARVPAREGGGFGGGCSVRESREEWRREPLLDETVQCAVGHFKFALLPFQTPSLEMSFNFVDNFSEL